MLITERAVPVVIWFRPMRGASVPIVWVHLLLSEKELRRYLLPAVAKERETFLLHILLCPLVAPQFATAGCILRDVPTGMERQF